MREAVVSLSRAVAFLTILPFPCPLAEKEPPDALAKAMGWFPLVGAGIGAVAAGAILWSETWASSRLATALGLAVLVILTGGLHLDGFADTVDGLSAWKGKEETLRIMGDSRVGVLGAVGLFLLLTLKWTALTDLALFRIVGALATACSLSRLSMVLSAHRFPYVEGKSGLGRRVTDFKSSRALWMAVVIGVATAWAGAGFINGTLAVVVMAAAAWVLNKLVVRRLGGITGDTLGAVGEGVELILLLFLVAVR